MRYSTATILKDENLKRYYDTIIFPTAPQTAGDTYIQTTSIDRLDKLAYIFYGDSSQWWVIAAANALGKGTYVIPAGIRLRIPSNENIQQVIIETNNNR